MDEATIILQNRSAEVMHHPRVVDPAIEDIRSTSCIVASASPHPSCVKLRHVGDRGGGRIGSDAWFFVDGPRVERGTQ